MKEVTLFMPVDTVNTSLDKAKTSNMQATTM